MGRSAKRYADLTGTYFNVGDHVCLWKDQTTEWGTAVYIVQAGGRLKLKAGEHANHHPLYELHMTAWRLKRVDVLGKYLLAGASPRGFFRDRDGNPFYPGEHVNVEDNLSSIVYVVGEDGFFRHEGSTPTTKAKWEVSRSRLTSVPTEGMRYPDKTGALFAIGDRVYVHSSDDGRPFTGNIYVVSIGAAIKHEFGGPTDASWPMRNYRLTRVGHAPLDPDNSPSAYKEIAMPTKATKSPTTALDHEPRLEDYHSRVDFHKARRVWDKVQIARLAAQAKEVKREMAQRKARVKAQAKQDAYRTRQLRRLATGDGMAAVEAVKALGDLPVPVSVK